MKQEARSKSLNGLHTHLGALTAPENLWFCWPREGIEFWLLAPGFLLLPYNSDSASVFFAFPQNEFLQLVDL
jgi:hypothetical protein